MRQHSKNNSERFNVQRFLHNGNLELKKKTKLQSQKICKISKHITYHTHIM